MKTTRFLLIDFLKAIGILGVIGIHTLSYNYSPQRVFLWNYLQFVVPLFVFCSGFLIHQAYATKIQNTSDLAGWYTKRIQRLLFPFYCYFFIHTALIFLFPSLFAQLEIHPSVPFVVSSLFLTGGINTNWLPLLFIELALLTPFLLKNFYTKKLFLFVGIALLLTALFTLFTFPYQWYRYVMWIPWSLIYLSGMYLASKQNHITRSGFFFFTIVFLTLWISIHVLFTFLGKPTTFLSNKYPPNALYLTYGLFWISILLTLPFERILSLKWLKQLYLPLSIYSYSLFFIHFIILDILQKQKQLFAFSGGLFIEFLLTVGMSMLIALGIKRLRK